MDDLSELLKKYDFKPLGYKKNKSVIVINTKDNKYVIKKREKDNSYLFNYLRTRSFNFFPYNYVNDDNYEITKYIEDKKLPKYDRAVEIINLMSLLHNKTTSYEDIDIDDYKIIYENLDQQIKNLTSYFNNLNDFIDNEIYMSPANYLLVRNISKINASLSYCKQELDSWYDLIKDNPKQRKVIINNNLELDHLVVDDNSYLISWDKAKKDLPIYDIYKFYKNSYRDIEFESLFDLYNSKYPLHEEEKKLLLIMLSLPHKIDFINDEYKNCQRVNELLEYMLKTEKIVLQYNQN